VPKNARLVPRSQMNEKTTRVASVRPPAEEEIDRAVKRVYQRYGPDLSVFFRAVQNQGQLELGLEKHEREQDNRFRTGE
jgi:hypothetical protein